MHEIGHRPSLTIAITIVVIILLIGSLPVIFVCGITLWGTIWVTHEIKYSPILYVIFGLPFVFGITGIVTSIGLLFLREWARRSALYLATLPVLSCFLFLIFYHAQIASGLSTVDDPHDIYRFIAGVLLAILAPVSVWWWFLFTSESVRERFREPDRK